MDCLKKRFILGLVSLLLTSLSYAAVPQVFHRGNSDEVESLDPVKVTSLPALNVLIDLYEGLTTLDQGGKVILGQAKSYSISKELKTFTFILKDNLKWSNGDRLTADDFVAGLRRTVDPKVGSIYSDILKPIKNAEKIITGALKVTDLGIKAPDDKTVIIELEKPTPYFLELLSHSSMFPIHQPSLRKYGRDFAKPGNLVSNGPFRLSEWVVHSHLSLVKNPNYIDAAHVKLDKVIFYPIQEQSVELNRYRAGGLDFTYSLPDVQFDWIKKHLGKELYIHPNLANYYYGFNLKQEPFKNNKNLRKALALAIDKKVIAQKVLRSGQIPNDYFIPDKIANYDTVDVRDKKTKLIKSLNLTREQRLQKAREYYKLAGYSLDKPAKIKITYNTSESHKNVAIALAAMFKQVLNVQTELVNQEWKVFMHSRQEKKDTQLFRGGWTGDYNDPSTFLDIFSSDNPQNYISFNNKEFDNLLKQAANEPDRIKRADLLLNAEKVLLDEAAVIPLYTLVTRHLVKPRVGGFEPNILDRTYDKYIYIN